jgi:hypothetical protein
MESTKYIYWQDQDLWLGYLEQYPDYWTQGQSLEDLEAHLRDLYKDLTSGAVPPKFLNPSPGTPRSTSTSPSEF